MLKEARVKELISKSEFWERKAVLLLQRLVFQTFYQPDCGFFPLQLLCYYLFGWLKP